MPPRLFTSELGRRESATGAAAAAKVTKAPLTFVETFEMVAEGPPAVVEKPPMVARVSPKVPEAPPAPAVRKELLPYSEAVPLYAPALGSSACLKSLRNHLFAGDATRPARSDY